MRLCSCTVPVPALLLLLLSVAEATDPPFCRDAITERHLRFLDELIDSQLQSSCTVTLDFVDPAQVTDEVCYIQAAFEFLYPVLDSHMNFKEGSRNFNTTEEVKKLHEFLLLEHCITAPEKGCCKQCAKTFTVSPQEMLEMVKTVFQKSQKLLQNNGVEMKKDCTEQFEQCRSWQLPSATGPLQCDCSCPSLPNLSRVEPTYLLTTSSNWERLPNTSAADPATVPAWQGSRAVRDTSIPDTAYTPEFRDSSSGQGSFKSPGQSVHPSFIISPAMADSVPHDFSTEPRSVPFTLVPDSRTFTTGHKNSMNGAESGGATAVAQTVGTESSQSHSLQPVHLSSIRRRSGEGSGDELSVSDVSSVPQNNRPAVTLSGGPSPLTPLLVSKKNENPAKESSAPKVPFKGTLTGLEQLNTEAKSPSKQHSSEFRSKGGGERFNEREEQFAGPRSEVYSFSVTDAGKGSAQGRPEPESQSTLLFMALLTAAGLLLLLLSVCGLLYYRHKSKMLERQLRVTQPEERPLNEELVELQGIV